MGGENSGRYDTFKDEYCDLAKKYCLLGAIDQDLADFFNVCIATIQNWKLKHPKFVKAIREGKAVADAKVAESLFHRACGYKHPDTHFSVVSDGQGEGSHVEKEEIVKHYPPDSTACIFWLKNRRPDRWTDKKDVEAKINVNDTINYDKIKKEDREKISQILEGTLNNDEE
jgi:hypothetical protein